MSEQRDDATELDLVYEDLRQAKARIEELEKALREIVDERDGCVSPGFKAKARAALAKGQDK